MHITEYLVYRFVRNNHNKYHKYCKEWIENLTTQQIIYFEKEKQGANIDVMVGPATSMWNVRR